jgi:hypothetical protein
MSEFTLANCVGHKIELVNVLNQKIQGEIFAYDPSLELLALCLIFLFSKKKKMFLDKNMKVLPEETSN